MAERKRHPKVTAESLRNQQLMVDEFATLRRLTPDETLGQPLCWWGDMPPTAPGEPWLQLVASDTPQAHTHPTRAEWFVRATLAKGFDVEPNFATDEVVLCRVPEDLVPLVQVRKAKWGITFGVIAHSAYE